MMININIRVSDWLKSEGYEPSHYSQPYSYFKKDAQLVGICITCGSAITGIVGQPIRQENRRRWLTRSVDELKKIIDERVPEK